MVFVSSVDNGEFSIRDTEALSALIGGTMVHLIVGVKIMWGCMSPYVTSYLNKFDQSVNFNSTLHVYTAVVFGQTLSMYPGGILETKIGPRFTSLIGACFIAGGAFFSSYCRHLTQLLVCQTFVGIGTGIAYSAPITCGFKHFPLSRGVVTGIITTGTGAGPFLFNFFVTGFVNPGNAAPMDAFSGLYHPDSPVVSRVPEMFRMLALLFGVIGITGSLLLQSPTGDPENQNKDTSHENGVESTNLITNENNIVTNYSCATEKTSVVPSYNDLLTLNLLEAIPDAPLYSTAKRSSKKVPKGHPRLGVGTMDMIRDPLCWLVIACKICTCIVGMFVVATYKSFGRVAIPSDHFLTVAGNMAILCSALSRSMWGSLADKIGTFRTIEIVGYLNPILLLLYTFTADSRIAFSIFLCSLLIVWGSNFALYPSVAAMLFGEENMGPNYGFIFFAFGLISTLVIDSCGYTSFSFHTLNLYFVLVGLLGGILASILKVATRPIKDETFMKHHRATSSIGSIF
mmetsp:Transcript_27166/g.38929  ORF Transcript_27166/g.38929 Transcript_27166/m.38929 type:complete len:514 (+) Transcript_27166:206-1747(+)